MHAVERVDLRLEALAAQPVDRALGAKAVTEDLKAFQQRLVDLCCMHYSVHCSP